MKLFLDCLAQVPTTSIGTQAFILANMQLINEYLGHTSVIMLAGYPEMDYYYCANQGFDVRVDKRTNSATQTIRSIMAIKKEVDAIVSAWGDGYISTPPHTLLKKVAFFRSKTKPAVLFPSSIGPFTGGYKSFLARIGLNIFDVVMARDTITYEWLKDIGVHNVELVPDTAFILDRADDARIQEILSQEGVPSDRAYIGLNISKLLNHLYRQQLGVDYPQFMAELATSMSESYGRHVILIPHQIYPAWFDHPYKHDLTSGHGDDRTIINEVVKYLRTKDIATPIVGEYNPREYKGIISRCEMFVGGRMHSAIGAVSSGVPSVLIQYSHKASGVMELVGLRDFVWDFKAPREQLLEMIEHTWKNRTFLRSDISQKVTEVKKQVGRAGILLREVLASYGLQ